MELFLLLISGALILGSHCLSAQLLEGSSCTNSNSVGVCTLILHCPQALKELRQKNHHSLTRCGFSGLTEIVCCPPAKQSISEKICTSYKNDSKAGLYSSQTSKDGQIMAFKSTSPHTVALAFYKKSEDIYSFDCGGTLVSPKFIVTAAHCIANLDQNPLKFVRMGAVIVPSQTDEMDSFYDYNVTNIFVHSNFSRKHLINDIAVVELEREATFNKQLRPACLYTTNDDPEELMVSGWGEITMNGPGSIILQKTSIVSVPLQQCAKKYLEVHKVNISSYQICAISPNSDSCRGDSGGPLYFEKDNVAVLVGVVSFGSGCGGRIPGVYTRISSYIDWIEDLVWG